MKNYFLSLCFLLLSVNLFSQNSAGFEISRNPQVDPKCGYFNAVFKNTPKEVRFSIQRENDKLFFETNNKAWFQQLFKSAGDGVAIDIVAKSRYECGKTVDNSQIRGKVTKPVFGKQLVRGLRPHQKERFRTFVAKIPADLMNQDLEFNMLFLNNKVLCRYQTIYNLEAYPWDLLDMGVYLDSLTFKTQEIGSIKDKTITKYKKLKFVIPFQKNKAEYLPEDIKPLYDSLRLTDFNIKKININAYSSIEGSLARNIELQEQRANSIAKSLQSFQKPNIVTTINSSENWVEFLNDVGKTPYKDFKKLSKKQIKQKVIGKVSVDLEPYLKNHRKAVVTLDLERIDKYKDMTTEKLISIFKDLILKDEVDEALVVQNSIFDKLKEENSPDKLRQLEVPRQKKYIDISNKNSIFFYLLKKSYAKVAFDRLKLLEKIDPKNKKIKYNLIVTKFVIWRNNWEKIDITKFKNEIKALQKYGIDKSLIDRMLVNCHIVKAEKNLRAKQYDAKDNSVEFIIDTYENFSFSNFDYLSLAQFLAFYSHKDDATDLLDDVVRKITVDEDLLFYYINLTITDKYNVASNNYRTILLNAANMNLKRFCNLFNNSKLDGVTFQLLENEYLRNSYCESCKNDN